MFQLQGLRFTSETVLRQLYQHQFWPGVETDQHLFWVQVLRQVNCRKLWSQHEVK